MPVEARCASCANSLGGPVDHHGPLFVVDMGGGVSCFMVLHPQVHVGNEAVFGGKAKQLTPGNAVCNFRVDVGAQPASYQLPAKFVSDLEVRMTPERIPFRSTSLNCPMRASFSLTASKSVSPFMEFRRLSSSSGMISPVASGHVPANRSNQVVLHLIHGYSHLFCHSGPHR